MAESTHYKSADACPDRAKHTPDPPGYLAWHEWAEKKAKTHVQIQCPYVRLLGDLEAQSEGRSMTAAKDRRGTADRALGGGIGYARRHGVLGDVRRINTQRVSGITHDGRPFSWKRGPDVELIEFGSFNPRNPNYEEGGRVIGH